MFFFSCAGKNRVKSAPVHKPKTLTELHKAELHQRRLQETSQQSQSQTTSSSDSFSSEVEESAKGLYVYRVVDDSRRGSVEIVSSKPPQRAKSLERCRPPPLVLAQG